MHRLDEFLKHHLNDEQYAAASYISGNSLILAGAGSGKTRTLTYKIANLIYGQGVHPARILAVTFTNKAAAEMKERIQSIIQEIKETSSGSSTSPTHLDFDALLQDSSVQSAGTSALPTYHWRDYQRIGTFHSIFLKILKQDIERLGKSYTKQFTVYDANDAETLTRNIIKQHHMQETVELKTSRSTISKWKNAGRTPSQAAHYCETQMDERILEIYQHYQKALEDANAVDFDDLLLLPKELFQKDEELLKKWQNQFSYILVDEAQDTNAIQFELMRMIAGNSGNITFIGDDYQSIYRRRGAVMDNFLRVDQRRSDIRIFKLETNYRSKPHIVAAGNAIIKNNIKQYEKNVVAHRAGEDKIRVFTFSDETDEAIQIIGLITKLKEEAQLHWSDFTILYRTNAQSSPFEQILLTESIPYKVVGAFKFFERAEIKDMLAYLRVLINPKDTLSMKRIINTPKRNIGQTTIDQLEQIAFERECTLCDILEQEDQLGQLPQATVTKLRGFMALIHSLRATITDSSPAELIEQIVQQTDYKIYAKKTDGDEKGAERMENIGQLINIASKYQESGHDALIQFMEEISLMTSIEETSVEQADAVRLMTVHSSKGLEFPYVFLVGLEEGVFPLPNARFDTEDLEEERRGMYVAITRAKDHLFLSHAQSRQQRGQIKYNPPSRFLEEIPQELLKRYDLGGQSTRVTGPQRDAGDRVVHKLFGAGTILEVWDKIAIVRFDNYKFGVRKLEGRFLQSE